MQGAVVNDHIVLHANSETDIKMAAQRSSLSIERVLN